MRTLRPDSRTVLLQKTSTFACRDQAPTILRLTGERTMDSAAALTASSDEVEAAFSVSPQLPALPNF